MTFEVIDNKTGKEADLEDIAFNEEWARSLMHCDMQGFAITDEGDLIMLDECGNYEFCPQGRFTVVQESVIDKIRVEIKSMFPPSGAWTYDEGHEVEHTVCEVLSDVLNIIDKYTTESEEV